MQKRARAPGSQSFCWGLHWRNILTIRVSEDRSQAEGRRLHGLAQQRNSEDRQTSSDGQVGLTHRVAVRWKAAAEDSDCHLGTKGEADAGLSWPTIMSASLDLDQWFVKGRRWWGTLARDCKVYKSDRWVNALLNNQVPYRGYFLWSWEIIFFYLCSVCIIWPLCLDTYFNSWKYLSVSRIQEFKDLYTLIWIFSWTDIYPLIKKNLSKQPPFNNSFPHIHKNTK